MSQVELKHSINCLCQKLHDLFEVLPRLRFPLELELPKNGIYILFENGEPGHCGDRVVRVGTHTGNNQLKSRLKQHFLTENKDRSIFRKNIGRALLNKEGDPYLVQWDWDLTSRSARERYQDKIDINKQARIEGNVSSYIQKNLSFVVFEVPDKEERLLLESRIISTVSKCSECGPSKSWLGNYSPKIKIQESGLWLVNELYKEELSIGELDRLECLIRNTVY